jgi:hypothetical protein
MIAAPIGDEHILRQVAHELFWPMSGNGSIKSLMVTLKSWTSEFENVLVFTFLVTFESTSLKQEFASRLPLSAKTASCHRGKPALLFNVSISELRVLVSSLCTTIVSYDLRLIGNQLFMHSKMMNVSLTDGFLETKQDDGTFTVERKL